MKKPIRSTTVDDGSKVQLRKTADGRYRVEDGDGNRIEDPVESRERAEQQFENTVRFTNDGIASQRDRGGGMGSMGGGFGGGMDGGLGMSDDDGGLFGGGGDLLTGGDSGTDRDADSDDSGSLFGGGGSLFGGGGGGRKRDPDSGRFAPSRRRDVNFEMERNENGEFKGRKDDDGGGGLFGFLR